MRWIQIISLFLLFLACQPQFFDSKWTYEKAPRKFIVHFESTHGPFEIEAFREWSPAGVDRLYQLVKHGFYQDMAVFRVVPDYVVQFGISNDSLLNRAWSSYKVPDEPVLQKNEFGTVAFARSGPDTRSTQLFINIGENSPRLDTINYKGVSGFPVIARVIDGMDNVVEFFGEYGNGPIEQTDSILRYGNKWLQANYPELDYIESAEIVREYPNY